VAICAPNLAFLDFKHDFIKRVAVADEAGDRIALCAANVVEFEATGILDATIDATELGFVTFDGFSESGAPAALVRRALAHSVGINREFSVAVVSGPHFFTNASAWGRKLYYLLDLIFAWFAVVFALDEPHVHFIDRNHIKSTVRAGRAHAVIPFLAQNLHDFVFGAPSLGVICHAYPLIDPVDCVQK
jgi:hypothetical protein